MHYRILGIVQYSDEGRERRIIQLRKGILELAVMGVLYHERHYGYSLRMHDEDIVRQFLRPA